MRGYMNMSLHKLKDDFQMCQKDIVIVKDKVLIKDKTLYLINNDTTLKFENGEWFVKTQLTNNDYISLGLGALPTYYIEDANIENVDAFNSLFEVCNEAEEN